MSGIYIKGVKLPTIHEGQMVIRIAPSGKADVQWSGMVGGNYTKAVEVPDHGRLIDADKFSLWLSDWQKHLTETYGENDEYVKCLESVIDALEACGTVIEADKEDNDQCGM